MDYADLRLESCTDKIQHSVRRQDDKLLGKALIMSFDRLRTYGNILIPYMVSL